MIRHSKLLFGVLICFAAVGCLKEKDPYAGKSKPVSFVVGELSCDGDEVGKVTDHPSGATHSLYWDKGDQISMIAFKEPAAAGELSSDNVVNFSSNRFTSDAAGRIATFTGNIPDLAGTLGSGTCKLYAIYPAASVNVAARSTNDYGAVNYNLTGLSIADFQDGTGWKYCWFVSNDGTIDIATRAVKNSPSFMMANTLLKFKYISTKRIRKIEITVSMNTSGGGLAGDFVLYTKYKAVQTGCPKTTITISNGSYLPTEILFACREVRKDRTLTFVFTAEDGTTFTKSLTASAAYNTTKMYDLGTISLGNWVSTESAAEAAYNMGVGLNLCGTFDDVETPEGRNPPDRNDISTFETLHAQGITTQTTMNATAAAGFKSMRIPITWYPHMDDPSSTIDDAMLDRIEEIVNYCFNAGLYCIINMHHDGGPVAGKAWLRANWANYEDISAKYKNVWRQIAERFKDYGPHLLFESFNEIRDAYSTWFQPRNDIDYQAVNALNQDFVDVVRATGGTNTTRNLIVSTYTASTREKTLQNFVMPSDAIPGHLMVQIHSYLPVGFVTASVDREDSRSEFYDETDIPEIEAMFETVRANILAKGWPCVMGEYGAFRKNNNDVQRGHHAAVYTERALRLGIVPLYWYNPMSWSNRTSGTWTYPPVKDSLIAAYNRVREQ